MLAIYFVYIPPAKRALTKTPKPVFNLLRLMNSTLPDDTKILGDSLQTI
jgi:hypothetical protein